jgi:hypothetical protein
MKKKKKQNNDKCKSIFDKKNKSNIITVKTSLKSILKNYDTNFIIINDLVKECNDIVIITYLFIRLYFLYCYNNKKDLPDLNKDNILYFIRACAKKTNRGRSAKNKEFENELEEFYDNEFKSLLNGKEKFNLKNKSYITPYLAIQIETAYKNNISEHFITRIRRILNITKPETIYDNEKQEKINKIKELYNNKEIDKKEFNKQEKEINTYYNKLWNSTKNNILLNKNNEYSEYDNYVKWIKNNFLPDEVEKNYGYDVKANYQKYIFYTLKMNDYIEKETDKKLFQSLSLRNEIKPHYITLDVNSILSIFNNEFKGQKDLNQKTKDKKNYIWSKIFYTDNKVMKKKGFSFDTLLTDGIGVSLIFKKNGIGKYQLNNNIIDNNIYIDELNNEDKEIIKNKKIIAIDPGKKNLIYAMDGNKNKIRYTANQRKIESMSKRNNRIIRNEKKKNKIIKEETKLSSYNCKTNDINKFKDYIKEKIKLNDNVKDFYNQDLLRKLKWRNIIYKRKSEDKLLNAMENKFGKSEDIIISYGNWNNSKQMKHIMPTMGNGLKKVIEKKFNTLILDEFKTSKLCSCCYNELENYKCDNKKLHRLLICCNCKSDGCESKNITFINRDINACQNMLTLTHHYLLNNERKKEFCRKLDYDLNKEKDLGKT